MLLLLPHAPTSSASHEAIKQENSVSLQDIDARNIDIYSKEARSPRLPFLLAPSRAASDFGRLESGSSSAAHRPPFARTPLSPTLGSRGGWLFNFPHDGMTARQDCYSFLPRRAT